MARCACGLTQILIHRGHPEVTAHQGTCRTTCAAVRGPRRMRQSRPVAAFRKTGPARRFRFRTRARSRLTSCDSRAGRGPRTVFQCRGDGESPLRINGLKLPRMRQRGPTSIRRVFVPPWRLGLHARSACWPGTCTGCPDLVACKSLERKMLVQPKVSSRRHFVVSGWGFLEVRRCRITL